LASPFPLPLIFTAWGFRRGADAWTGGNLWERCKASGIKTVAVQFGLAPSGTPWTLPEEAKLLRDHGLRVVVWGVAYIGSVMSELQRLGAKEEDWFPQIEGPWEAEPVLDAIAHGLNPQAIVTTYSGAGSEDRSMVQKLRAGGVKAVFIESYATDGHADLDRMLWQGTQYGWRTDELFAVPGVYGGEFPTAYKGIEKVGRDFGIYLGEPMSVAQWDAWGKVNPPTVPPPPSEIPDPGVVRKQADQLLQTWLQPYLNQNPSKPQHTSIIRLADRLLKLTGSQQDNFNEDLLVKELDRIGSPRF
jgi:hypothetical protein